MSFQLIITELLEFETKESVEVALQHFHVKHKQLPKEFFSLLRKDGEACAKVTPSLLESARLQLGLPELHNIEYAAVMGENVLEQHGSNLTQ